MHASHVKEVYVCSVTFSVSLIAQNNGALSSSNIYIYFITSWTSLLITCYRHCETKFKIICGAVYITGNKKYF